MMTMVLQTEIDNVHIDNCQSSNICCSYLYNGRYSSFRVPLSINNGFLTPSLEGGFRYMHTLALILSHPGLHMVQSGAAVDPGCTRG